jgi:hypothetical protein
MDATTVIHKSKNKHGGGRVFIMEGQPGYGQFWCLDVKRNKWFRLHSYTDEQKLHYNLYSIFGTGKGDSELCLIRFESKGTSMLILNLQYDADHQYNIIGEDGHNFFFDLECSCMVHGNLIIGKNVQSYLDNEHKITTSTLYVGRFADNSVTMASLLSFRNDEIKQVCMNKSLTIAIIFESMKGVYLYDLADYKMEVLKLDVRDGGKLAGTKNGFIIYGNNRLIQLTRKYGSKLSSTYLITEIPFHFNLGEYFFSGDVWFHNNCKKYSDEMVFECVSHSKLIGKTPPEVVWWKQLRLPKRCIRGCNDVISNLFEINLPKGKLQCSISCSKCIKAEQKQRDEKFNIDERCKSLYTDNKKHKYISDGPNDRIRKASIRNDIKRKAFDRKHVAINDFGERTVHIYFFLVLFILLLIISLFVVWFIFW